MAHILSQSLSRSSESENEELNTRPRKDGVVVAGEVPEESDEELFEDASDKTPALSMSPRRIPGQRKGMNDEYQSLLHRKLRERNERLHKDLIRLNRNPYRESIRMVEESSTGASRSRAILSDSSDRLKRLRDDIYLLKVAFDRLLINSSSLPRFKTFQDERGNGTVANQGGGLVTIDGTSSVDGTSSIHGKNSVDEDLKQ